MTDNQQAPIHDRRVQFQIVYYAIAVAIGVWSSWGEGLFITFMICAACVFIAAVALQMLAGAAGLFVPRDRQ